MGWTMIQSDIITVMGLVFQICISLLDLSTDNFLQFSFLSLCINDSMNRNSESSVVCLYCC